MLDICQILNDDINIFSQVSLNLNDISSHTKQMGETSRLVQQVMMISKCHPKVSVSYWIQILNISILVQGVPSDHLVGERQDQNGGGGGVAIHPPHSHPPPTLDFSSSTNNSCPPPSFTTSSSAIVTMSGTTATTTSAIVTMTSTPSARVTDLFDTERGQAAEPGSQVISNFQTFKSIFYNFVCVP